MHLAEYIGFGSLFVSAVTALVIAVWKLSAFSSTFDAAIKTLSERLNEVKEDRASIAMVNEHARKIGQLEANDLSFSSLLSKHDTRITVLEDWRQDWRVTQGSKPFIERGHK